MKLASLVLPAKIVLTLALAIGLVATVDLQRLGQAARGLAVPTVAGAAALLGLQALLFARRWQRLLALQGQALPLPLALRWVWVGLFFNQALPASVGGDVMRVWLLHRRGSAPGTAFASVAMERLSGVALLALMVSACTVGLWAALPGPVAAALVAVGPALILVLAALAWVDHLPLGWLPTRVLPSLQATAAGLRALLGTPAALLAVTVQGLAAHLLGIAAAYVLGRAMGVDAPFATVLVLVGGAVLVSVLPVSLGGWGVREASMVSLATLLGVRAESALAMSLAWGTLQLVVSLPGGVLWWLDVRSAPGAALASPGPGPGPAPVPPSNPAAP